MQPDNSRATGQAEAAAGQGGSTGRGEVSAGATAALNAGGEDLSRGARRAMKRLGPFLILMYVVSFLDRANIGFAKQALQASEGINERVYALAAGLFFISYSVCGFPSNLVLHKIGAKVWMTFLLVMWGLVSMEIGRAHV